MASEPATPSLESSPPNAATAPQRPLLGKVRSALVWVVSFQVITKVLTLAAAVALARLLEPREFGLMAMATAVMSFVTSVSSAGFASALLQKSQDAEGHLNVAWTLEFIRLLVLALLVIGLAPFISEWLQEPQLVLVLQVVALLFLLRGSENVGVILYRKNLEFSKVFVYQTIPVLVYAPVVILAAYLLRSVWALVIGMLSERLTSVLLSYVLHPHRPRVEFHWGKTKALFGFGMWISATQFINMVRKDGVTFVIAKLLGTVPLGYYNRGCTFSMNLFEQLQTTLWQVGYPALAAVQHDRVQARRVFLRMLGVATFVMTPAAVGVWVLTDPFIRFVLTEKWLPIAPVMKVLSLESLLLFVTSPCALLFQSQGSPSIWAKNETIRLAVVVVLVVPLTLWFGLPGVVWVALLSHVAIITPALVKARRMIGATWGELLGILAVPASGALCMVAVASGLALACGAGDSFVLSVLCAASAAVVYLGWCLLLERWLGRDGCVFLLRQVISSGAGLRVSNQ